MNISPDKLKTLAEEQGYQLCKWRNAETDPPYVEGEYICKWSDGTIETFHYDPIDCANYWGITYAKVTEWLDFI